MCPIDSTTGVDTSKCAIVARCFIRFNQLFQPIKMCSVWKSSTVVTRLKYRLSTLSLPVPSSAMMKKLALVRLATGVLTLLFGIGTAAFLHHGKTSLRTGSAIWMGGYTTIVGVVGVQCALRYTSKYLNMMYMLLNVASTAVSVTTAVSFGHFIDEYSKVKPYDCTRRHVGITLYVPLMVFMVFEFFAAFVAVVFSWQYRRQHLGVFRTRNSTGICCTEEKFWCKQSGSVPENTIAIKANGVIPPRVEVLYQNGLVVIDSEIPNSIGSNVLI